LLVWDYAALTPGWMFLEPPPWEEFWRNRHFNVAMRHDSINITGKRRWSDRKNGGEETLLDAAARSITVTGSEGAD
jgi:hypothetical protein